jgi:hypothetical protein
LNISSQKQQSKNIFVFLLEHVILTRSKSNYHTITNTLRKHGKGEITPKF